MKRDKGFSWIVLLSSFLTVMFSESVISLPSLYILEYTEAFAESQAIVGLTGGINSGIMAFMGIPTGISINKFGCRITCSLGAFLIFTGLLLSAFAPNIIVIMITYGVLASIGESLAFNSAIVVIHHYFDKYQSFASGFVMCGFGVGQIVFIPLLRILIDEFGWRGAHAIHGAIMLHMLIFAQAFRPTHQIKQSKGNLTKKNSEFNMTEIAQEDDQINTENKIEKTNKELDVMMSESNSLNQEDNEITTKCQLSCDENKKSKQNNVLVRKIKKYLDTSLFQNPSFILFNISHILCAVIDEIGYKLVVPKAFDTGIGKFNASMLRSYMGLSALIARLIFSIVANLRCSNVIIMNGIFIILASISLCILNITWDYTSTVVMCVLIGVFFSGVYGLKYCVLAKLIGRNRLASALGWHQCLLSVPYFITLPIAGIMYDKTGSYDMSFYFAGSVGCVGGILILVVAGLNMQKRSNVASAEA